MTDDQPVRPTSRAQHESPRSDATAGGKPAVDYRFSYANERTFLAWVRTSVALIGVGVVAEQFLPPLDSPGGRRAVGLAFLVLGAVICVVAQRQWAANARAMQEGRELPRSVLVPVVSIGVVLLAVVVAALSVFAS